MNKYITGFFLFLVLPTLYNTSYGQEHQATAVSETLLEGLKFRSVGPSRGGRVTAVTGFREKPFRFLMGATGGGIWLTNDAGQRWKNISDGQLPVGSIGALEVAKADPQVIYAGTGESCPRGNVSPGMGIFKSTDGGKNWKYSGLDKVGQIAKVISHPTELNKVYVAAIGQIFGKNKERGIFKTNDGGMTWDHVFALNDSTGAVDLIMDPSNSRVLYAAMWQVERKPWTIIDGNMDGGIWKTSDGGENWKKLESGLPTGLIGRIGLAIAPSQTDRVYAIIRAEDPQSGVYRTDDGGDTWKRMSKENKLTQRAWYYNHISVDPLDANTVYVNNVGLWKSIDGGQSFPIRIRTPHSDHHGLWINPDNPDILINANDGGACVSLNGGESWSTQMNQPTAQFYRLSVDNQFPYRLYAGQQDNTTISVSSNPSRNVTQFGDWFSVGGGESADVAVHPEDPDIIWAGTYSGEISIVNRETGEYRQVTAYPHYTEGTEQRDLKYRWQWNFPILISKHHPEQVYHTSNYVHRTTNNGQNWEVISPDLTRSLDKYHSIPGGPVQHDATGVEVYSSIFAFEESPNKEGVFWAGSDDGLVHISLDNGTSWKNITPPNMPFEATINKIEVSALEEGRALVAAFNYRYNDFHPYIFLTDDYGKSWKMLTPGNNGIPKNHFVRCVAEHPSNEKILFAGTEFGLYLSFNEGKEWQKFQSNLPVVPITDMEAHQGDLVLSTQGRAFWILEDISLLSTILKMDSTKIEMDIPSLAYRTNIAGFNAKMMIYIPDSVLTDSLVEISILDSEDRLVRKLSTKAEKSLNKMKLTKGWNQIFWDLRHEGPDIAKDLVTMVIPNPVPGPPSTPGKYQVKLKTKDREIVDEVEIKQDPRHPHIRTSEFKEQLGYGLKIKAMIQDAHDILKDARSMRTQIKSLVEHVLKNANSTEMNEDAEMLLSKIDELESMIIQTKAKSSQDNINYKRVYSNHIGRLYSIVISGQRGPTAGSLERLGDLEKEHEQIVKVYTNDIQTRLESFNSKVRNRRVPAVSIDKIKP